MAALSGTVKDYGGANVARIVRAYRRDTGAFQAETTSSGSTGVFSITVPANYKYLVVVEDGVYDPYCQVLLHLDGVDNGTVFFEETGKAPTRVGSAKTSTAYSAFGGAAALLNGTTDYLTLPNSADILLGSVDFTLEGFFRPTALPTTGATAALISKYDPSGATRSYSLELFNSGGVQQIAVYLSSTGSVADFSLLVNFSCSLTSFTHIAVCRYGSNIYVFANGALLGTGGYAPALFANTAQNLAIGARSNGVNFFAGYVDEVRVSKGLARYTADFSANPITGPFLKTITYGSNALVYDDVVPT